MHCGMRFMIHYYLVWHPGVLISLASSQLTPQTSKYICASTSNKCSDGYHSLQDDLHDFTTQSLRSISSYSMVQPHC